MPHVVFTLCVIQVTEHSGCDCDMWFYYLCDSGCSVSSVRSVFMDVIVTCGFTLCLTQVTECGVDVIFTFVFYTLRDSGHRGWCGCDCDVWFYTLCDSGHRVWCGCDCDDVVLHSV